MRQQQLIEARRERREELRNQVQQLEKQVYRYQLKTSGRSGISLARINPFETRSEAGHTVLPSARTDHRLPESNESLIERLVQQNEHIMALLLPRRHEVVRNMINSESVAQHAPDKSPDVNKVHTKAQKEAPGKKPVPTFQMPTTLSWLPDFEWTDEDELTLDKLENNVDALPDLISEPLIQGNSTKENEATANPTDINASASKDQKARDRLESRKKLEALLNASLKTASGTALRKPRWRLESGAESDDVSPFDLEEAEVMEPIQIFRASVLAVLYTVQLKNMLMAKKLAEKESVMRDFEAMLRVYFDATRMWLGKVLARFCKEVWQHFSPSSSHTGSVTDGD
ncbi:uncharacterized protein IUM83_00901 [Phytophthora cinnamomi]|uniref:uncharacterized protein n=1 Tax=Phytophthora cinnamomi TaxID=4785 RepID=UPI00355AA885|nr:hypothetical protein IUM83_00901 [Phytophthora cinnamomi]